MSAPRHLLAHHVEVALENDRRCTLTTGTRRDRDFEVARAVASSRKAVRVRPALKPSGNGLLVFGAARDTADLLKQLDDAASLDVHGGTGSSSLVLAAVKRSGVFNACVWNDPAGVSSAGAGERRSSASLRRLDLSGGPCHNQAQAKRGGGAEAAGEKKAAAPGAFAC